MNHACSVAAILLKLFLQVVDERRIYIVISAAGSSVECSESAAAAKSVVGSSVEQSDESDEFVEYD
jgi:hypothetical protein